jgi:hypothetical protein
MAGEAKTAEFLLTTATVMIGPQAKVMELTPAEHSIGLVKNVQANAETGFTELTQGIQAQVVASVNTSNQTRISAEVYEYTARNLAYGAQLDGTDEAWDPITEQYALATAITTGGTSVALTTGSGADFAPNDYIVLQDLNTPDRVHVGKVASVATDTITLASGYAMPSGAAFPIATTAVFKVRSIKVGSVTKQPVYGMKMVGLLPETGQPVTLIFPKVKITKGINLAFQTDNFSNMPFEFTPYALLPSDPFYGDFGSQKTWQLLRT